MASAWARVAGCFPERSMNSSRKSTRPSRRPIGGISTSSTNDVTTLPNAPPTTTATARSSTFPRMTNALKSFSIAASPRPTPAATLDCSGPPCHAGARMVCLAFMIRLAPVLRRTLLALLLAASAAAAAPPSPESVLGFRPGDDRKLADWTQIVDYFHRLAAASGRVKVEEVGRTTEDRPFLVAIITSEANMAHLEEIRRANLSLADPRGLSEEDAARLVERGKTVVAINHGIHSTEVAATQTA